MSSTPPDTPCPEYPTTPRSLRNHTGKNPSPAPPLSAKPIPAFGVEDSLAGSISISVEVTSLPSSSPYWQRSSTSSLTFVAFPLWSSPALKLGSHDDRSSEPELRALRLLEEQRMGLFKLWNWKLGPLASQTFSLNSDESSGLERSDRCELKYPKSAIWNIKLLK